MMLEFIIVAQKLLIVEVRIQTEFTLQGTAVILCNSCALKQIFNFY